MIEINKNKLIPGIVATWGEITGNISNQSDLVEYISSHGGGNAEWGSISGSISNQSDLMDLVSSFATESWVEGQGYLTSVPSGYATESWVEGQGYLSSIPSGYATESWVEGQGYLTSVPSGYATESWVEGQGYLTSVPSEYVTEEWVSSQQFVTSSILTSYATQSWVGQTYVEKTDPPVEGLHSSVWPGGWYSDAQALYMCRQYEVSSCPSYIDSAYWTAVSAPFGADGVNANRQVYELNGELYAFNYLDSTKYIYKFDSLTSEFLPYVSVTGTEGIQKNCPLWADNSGRVYYGIYYTVDMSTGAFTSWNPGIVVSSFYSAVGGMRHNIMNVGSGIFFVSSRISVGTSSTNAVIFNETTQQFDSYVKLIHAMTSYSWFANSTRYNGETYVGYASTGSSVYRLHSSLEEGSVWLKFELLPWRPSDPTDSYYGNPMAYLQSANSVSHVHPVVMSDSLYAYPLCFRSGVKCFRSDNLEIDPTYATDYDYWSSVSMNGFFDGTNPSTVTTGCMYGSLAFGYFYSNKADEEEYYTKNKLIITSFHLQPSRESGYSSVYCWDSMAYQNLWSYVGSLDVRISSIESTLGSAVDITNNILGY